MTTEEEVLFAAEEVATVYARLRERLNAHGSVQESGA
jgi:hypothetical protein